MKATQKGGTKIQVFPQASGRPVSRLKRSVMPCKNEKDEIMSCWSKEQLDNMMEDVINELDLSPEMIYTHGQLGTSPSKLVRIVLDQKDQQIRMLKSGFKQIEA